VARKLKTYQTSLGFYDLAIAAPSMKAALEAWGAGSNLFHQGIAYETDDPHVVAATMAKPGVVLRRLRDRADDSRSTPTCQPILMASNPEAETGRAARSRRRSRLRRSPRRPRGKRPWISKRSKGGAKPGTGVNGPPGRRNANGVTRRSRRRKGR